MFTVISTFEHHGLLSVISAHEIYGVGCIVRTQTIIAAKAGANVGQPCSESSIFVPGVKLVERNREYSLQQIPMMQDGPIDTDV